VKRFGLLPKVTGFLLLNIIAFANIAMGQVTVSPTSINFGTLQTGTSSSQPLTLSNSSRSTVTVSLASVTGAGFSLNGPALPLTLISGQSATFGITFAPLSGGAVSGLVSVAISSTSLRHSGKHSSASLSSTQVTLSGTGSVTSPKVATPGILTANPVALNFSGVQVGNSQSSFAALTNAGGSTVTIAQATTTGTGFAATGLNLPLTLAAGQSITFSVTFAPLSSGAASGSVNVASDAATPTLAIPLAGTGTAPGQLAVTPVATNFGNVTVGTSKTQSGTLTATGSTVSLSSVGVTDSEFSLRGIAVPLTLAAGQSVPFTLTFTPRSSGVAAATVSFASNATNSTTQSLAGTGTAPLQHDVMLSWEAATQVVGYNIYRGLKSGGPYSQINPTVDATASYTDNTVQAGQTYYYVTTSVDAAGMQSAYSNETQAVIPSP